MAAPQPSFLRSYQIKTWIACLWLKLTSPDARRYFKQSEIFLYRQAPDIAPTPQVAAQKQIQQQQQQQQQEKQVPLPGAASIGIGKQAQ